MGVVNVTPDSFSDGGRWLAPDSAIQHGLELHEQGADIIDIGGESTRPGAQRPDESEELSRVLPVVRELAARGVCCSIDTMRAGVAARAVEAGAQLVNDVSGGLADLRMAATVVDLQVPMIAMHWRGHSHDMADRAVYDDVVVDVCRELGDRARDLLDAGLDPDSLVLDPGLGFAKTADQNWAILRQLEDVKGLGLPILIGASRKAFLAQVGSREPLPPERREGATTALTVLVAQAGVWGVRVHDVQSARTALAVTERMAATDE